jgi:galactofuranose transport system ATP-binding protein
MSEHLLKISKLSKSFAGIPAIDSADLQVKQGEVHALIGQNGAGKSTLIKALTGYVRKDSGDITFGDHPFDVHSPMAAQRAGISTIYQEINLVPMRSVAENICLGREMRRYGFLDWAAMEQEAKRLLGKFRITIDVRAPLSDFSTATQQMVAIARAIGFDAKLVIMDEPTSSLDAREADVLFDVIRKLKQSGVAVIYVSHKLDELYQICDRVTIMRDGRTVVTKNMRDVSKLELVSTMLGRDITKTKGKATGFQSTHKYDAVQPALLKAVNLGDGRIAQSVSLSLRPGEITALAGLLGSGRTETAHILFGSSQKRSGEIKLKGQIFAPKNPTESIAAGFGFCTEDRKAEGVIPEMSIADNMILALMPKLSKAGIVDRARQDAIVKDFISKLDIKCAGPDQKIRELSGGNQQKVLLARWLATDPRILILDEPTRGIDVGAKAEIQKLISTLAGQGLSVLMISSELEEVLEGADRAVVLREGKSIAELERNEITEKKVLAFMAEGYADG